MRDNECFFGLIGSSESETPWDQLHIPATREWITCIAALYLGFHDKRYLEVDFHSLLLHVSII